MSSSAYWAVIGDIVRSRRIADRGRFQAHLERLMDELNRRYAEAGLASRWTVTLGDEFQALFRTAEPLPDAVQQLFHGLVGHGVRFGIGFGTLATPLRPRAAVGMDGPCFHRARQALETAKHDRRMVAVEAGGPGGARAADVWNLALVLVAARTPRQVQAVEAYRDCGSQEKAAARLGVSQAAVSTALARGHHAEVSAVMPHIAALLTQAAKEGAGA